MNASPYRTSLLCSQIQSPEDLLENLKQSLQNILKHMALEWSEQKKQYERQIQLLNKTVRQKDIEIERLSEECHAIRNLGRNQNETPYRVLKAVPICHSNTGNVTTDNKKMNYIEEDHKNTQNDQQDCERSQFNFSLEELRQDQGIRHDQKLKLKPERNLQTTASRVIDKVQIKEFEKKTSTRYAPNAHQQFQDDEDEIFKQLSKSYKPKHICSQTFLSSNKLLEQLNLNTYLPRSKLNSITKKLNSSISNISQQKTSAHFESGFTKPLKSYESNKFLAPLQQDNKQNGKMKEKTSKDTKKICRKPSTINRRNLFVRKFEEAEGNKLLGKKCGMNCTIR